MSKIATRIKKLQREGISSRVTPSYFSFTDKITKELVEPGLHRLDYKRVVDSCEDYHYKSREFQNADVFKRTFCVPQHYIHDLQSMYTNPASDLSFQKNMNSGKKTKFKILQGVYDSLYKGFTENNPVYSNIMTMEIAKYLQWNVFSKLTEEQKKEMEDSQDENGGEPSQETQDKVEQLMKQSQSQLEKAMEEANETIKDMKDLGFGGQEAGDGTSDQNNLDINQIKNILSRVKSGSNDRLKKLFKVLLDNSKNYFTSKKKYYDESIFDAEELDEMEGLEYLNPSFKNAHLMDIVAKTSKSVGKVDLYIDCSGSMGSSLVEAKVIALKLLNMNYVHEVYYFDNCVYKPKQDFGSILKFDKHGGTNFDAVVDSINENNRNAVVLTDGCARTYQYTEKAFWVGIDGASFSSPFSGNDSSKKYLTNKQCIKFENSGKYTYDKYEQY